MKYAGFDIEPYGLDSDSEIAVAGFRVDFAYSFILNTRGRNVDEEELTESIKSELSKEAELSVVESEDVLLAELSRLAERLDDDCILTVFNGASWDGGFDLPFLRSSCIHNDAEWPFLDAPIVDLQPLFAKRVCTKNQHEEANNLASIYNLFFDSPAKTIKKRSSINAARNEDYEYLLRRNAIDVKMTYELSVIADKYVAQSDWQMKNLSPPQNTNKR